MQGREHWLVLARDRRLEGPLSLADGDIPLLEHMLVSAPACARRSASEQCDAMQHIGFALALHHCISPPRSCSLSLPPAQPPPCTPHTTSTSWSPPPSLPSVPPPPFPPPGQRVARQKVAELRRDKPALRFRLGFHALPSLRQLHLHVISQVGQRRGCGWSSLWHGCSPVACWMAPVQRQRRLAGLPPVQAASHAPRGHKRAFPQEQATAQLRTKAQVRAVWFCRPNLAFYLIPSILHFPSYGPLLLSINAACRILTLPA